MRTMATASVAARKRQDIEMSMADYTRQPVVEGSGGVALLMWVDGILPPKTYRLYRKDGEVWRQKGSGTYAHCARVRDTG